MNKTFIWCMHLSKSVFSFWGVPSNLDPAMRYIHITHRVAVFASVRSSSGCYLLLHSVKIEEFFLRKYFMLKWSVPHTVLQKLYEIKLHNTRIYMPLSFAWNQFWQKLNLKNCHFYNFRDSQLWILVNLGLEKWLKLLKLKFWTSKIA